jgi:murein DD-endopeptidase MepM/ murein hydrolase activator NlpD
VIVRKSCLIVALLVSGCAGRGGGGTAPAGGGGHDIDLAAGWRVQTGRVLPRTTLAALLRAHGILESDIVSTIARAASRFDLRKVRAAQPYRITTAENGSLRSLDYEIDGDRALHVRREADGDLAAEVADIPKSRRRVVVRGTIDRGSPSLFAAMDAAGESTDLSVALAEIFGGEIDFSTELQPGDHFEVVVEKQYREPGNAFAGYGPIIAAQIDNAGRRVRAVHFAPGGGGAGYYDERGVSMRRFFLKSPLKFEPTVTSSFSRSRFHPILREYRAHLGVDYRAPAGAPVVAVADGLVLQAEMSAGAGRFVHLRHANGYETEYLHLSSIAVRPGAHVRQGDVIGRVGSSGLATGPHLDYRVKRAGAFVDPLAVHRAMPPAEPVPAEQMAAFREVEEQTFAAFSDPASRKPAHALGSTHQQ